MIDRTVLFLIALAFGCRTESGRVETRTYVLCTSRADCPGVVRDNANLAVDRDGRTLGVYTCVREGANVSDGDGGSPYGRAPMGICLAAWKNKEPVELFEIHDPREAAALGVALLEVAAKADPIDAPLASGRR